MEHLERKDFAFELRAGDGDGAARFSGHAATWGLDHYHERFAPGCFQASIAQAQRSGRWPPMLAHHGFDGFLPIGSWLALAEDAKGHAVEGQLADTERGREVEKLLKMQPRPALNGLSVGFRPLEYVRGSKPDEPKLTFTKVQLLEISICNFPANSEARIDRIKMKSDQRAFEAQLRRLGLSQREAKAVVAAGWAGLHRDDPSNALGELVGAVKAQTGELQRLLGVFDDDRPNRHRGG